MGGNWAVAAVHELRLLEGGETAQGEEKVMNPKPLDSTSRVGFIIAIVSPQARHDRRTRGGSMYDGGTF